MKDEGEREIRLSVDQFESYLRGANVIDNREVVISAHIEPGELVVKLVREEAETEP